MEIPINTSTGVQSSSARAELIQYVDEAERLCIQCSGALPRFLRRRFVAGLDDEAKADMVQLYLNGKETITSEAKDAVIKANRAIERRALLIRTTKQKKHSRLHLRPMGTRNL